MDFGLPEEKSLPLAKSSAGEKRGPQVED
jgi:hypothetical protein